MKNHPYKSASMVFVFTALLLFIVTSTAQAKVLGLNGPSFNFTVKTDHVSIADGGSMLLWGYANGDGRAQYPGPTMIVNQGDRVTVTLTNKLAVAAGTTPNVSLVFPGHTVTTTCSTTGSCPEETLATEVPPDSTTSATYSFVADKPGTYTYHSGTNPGLQVEMGLTGVMIVRPAGFDPDAPTAYGHPDTAYDYEELFFLTEMDPNIHQTVEFYGPDHLSLKPMLDNYFSNYWFINGRTAPDDLAAPNVFWLPTQPYNSAPRMHPGDTVLMRVVGGGRDLHPFHHHGNHATVIARDGRMLESAPGAGPDLATEGFTITSSPGKSVDALFTWSGEGLNWDIYGGTDVGSDDPNSDFYHQCAGSDGPTAGVFDPDTHEYCGDHGKPFPVNLPGNQELAFGGWWGGSPYLGSLGALPPGEGGLNPNGGYSFMWHSHTEKELTNWDIFPGGMLTMMIIEPPGVQIDK